MKADMNRECMTFEEWVCAAGVAVIHGDDVVPYTTSRMVAVPVVPERKQYNRGFIERVCEAKRETKRNYPKKIRDAWRNGEDPTEWRAAL